MPGRKQGRASGHLHDAWAPWGQGNLNWGEEVDQRKRKSTDADEEDVLLPDGADPVESLKYSFGRQHCSEVDGVDELNHELIDGYNRVGEKRREILRLLKSKQNVKKELNRAYAQLQELTKKAARKIAEIEHAGGVAAFKFPHHFKKKPVLKSD